MAVEAGKVKVSPIRLTILLLPSIALCAIYILGWFPYFDQTTSKSPKVVNRSFPNKADIARKNIGGNQDHAAPKRRLGPRAHWKDLKKTAAPGAILRQAVANESGVPLMASYTGAPALNENSLRERLDITEPSLFSEDLFEQGPMVGDERGEAEGLAKIIDNESLESSQCSEELILKIMDGFVNPLDEWVCTTGFGARAKKGFHNGLDMASNANVPVYAIGNGKVVYAGSLPRFHAYGKVVVIDHGCGVFSLYGHVSPLKSLEKRKRRTKDAWKYMPVFVDAGFKIATLTSYKRRGESTTGPHLHLEILVAHKRDGRIRFTFHNPTHCLPLRKSRWFYPLLPEVYASRTLELKAISRGRETIRAPKLRGLRAVLESLDYPLALKKDAYPGLSRLSDITESKAINSHCLATPGIDSCTGMIKALECEKRERVACLLGRTGNHGAEKEDESIQHMNGPVSIRTDHQLSAYMRLEESLSNSIDLRIGVSSAQEL